RVDLEGEGMALAVEPGRNQVRHAGGPGPVVQAVEQPAVDEAVVGDADVFTTARQAAVVRSRRGGRAVAEAAGRQLQQGRVAGGEFRPPHGVAAREIGHQDVETAVDRVRIEGELVD